MNLNYIVPITECEIVEEKEGKPIRATIGGTCLKPTISRNGNKYSISNIAENDGKEVKMFIQEHGELQVKNIVGKLNLVKEGELLKYHGSIRNTKAHPDIIEHAMNKEIDVSIDARAKGKTIEKDGTRSWGNVDVRALCGVGVGGVAENSMEYAIAESLKDDVEDEEDSNENESEVTKMENVQEMEMLKTKLAEAEKAKVDAEDKVKKMEDDKEKEKVDAKESEKKDIIAEIMKVNKDSVEKELVEKEVEVLKTILAYEKKISEAEGESEEEGNGNVEGEGDEKPDAATEAEFKGIVVEKETDTIQMDAKAYKKFNEGLKNELYL